MRQFSKIMLTLVTIAVTNSCSLNASLKAIPPKEPEPNVYYPFVGFTSLANPDNYKLASVHWNGNGTAGAEPQSAFGYLAHGDYYGNFAVTNGSSISIQRADLQGPCGSPGGTAPNCPFTWGSGTTGLYHGRSVNTFPNLTNNSHTWSKIKYIRADIRMDLVTGILDVNGGGFAGCGLNLGLGSAGGTHIDLPTTLPTSLNIASRGSRSDMIMFSYHIYNGLSGTDRFRIETPVNSSSGSFGTDARWDSTFDMVEASPLTNNGDYIKYQMLLEFNQTTDVITVTLTPLATNKTLSLMKTQTVTWDVFASPSYTVGSEARAGIAVDHGGTGYALSKDQVKNSKVVVGFHMNGATKLCQLSNLVIGSFD